MMSKGIICDACATSVAFTRNGRESDSGEESAWITLSADNVRDMVTKGRGNYLSGENNRNSNLTADQVAQIRERRANGETLRTIALDMGASLSAVWNICAGRTWVHDVEMSK